MGEVYDNAMHRIKERTAVIAVIGLGYVGLPLCEAFVEAGYNVIGYDTDAVKVNKLLSGESYIAHFRHERVKALLSSGSDRQWLQGWFEPTTNHFRLTLADVALVCVPTPLTSDRKPDLSYVQAAGHTIAAYLKPHRGLLIVLVSTVYPGATEELLQPIFTMYQRSRGRDFYLAYSPEREDPGNLEFVPREIPRIVAGVDDESLSLVTALFGHVVNSVVQVNDIPTAEAAKLLENTYRAVNIALVNELKGVFTRMGIDIWEVVKAARTKPFGFQAFYPSPGVGGHCIPVDPAYLEWKANQLGQDTFLVNLAAQINRRMTTFVMERLEESFPGGWLAMPGSKILVLGVAYKKGVDDTRGSPAFPIMDRLYLKRAVVSYSDPHVPYLRCQDRHGQVIHMTSVPLTEELLTGQDAVIIVTDHTEFDYGLIAKHARLIIDTRNAMQCWTCNGRLVKA